jgi:Enterobacter phage Enc34, ssDNA-binding protein
MSTLYTTYLACELIRDGEKPQVRTPRGILSYPYLLEPSSQDSEDGTTKLKYGSTHIYQADADLTLLKETCYAVAAERFGNSWKTKLPNLHMPWHDSTAKNRNGVPHFEKIGIDPALFPIFIRCGSLASFGKPVVVTTVNNQLVHLSKDDADQIYPGRWARLAVSPYAYGDAKSTNKGISLGFEGALLLEDDEPLVARRLSAEQQFEAVPTSESASAMFK